MRMSGGLCTVKRRKKVIFKCRAAFAAIHVAFMEGVFFTEFVVIHNGIITNYKDIKTFLVRKI